MIKTKVGKLSASGNVGQVSVGTMSGYLLNDINDLFGVHHPRTRREDGLSWRHGVKPLTHSLTHSLLGPYLTIL